MTQSPTGVTSEGVDEWRPPAGFENPVPEPGGFGGRGGCGCATVVLILLAAIGVGAALLWPTISDTRDDVEKLIDDAKEAFDISTNGGGETETGIEADGRSDMPGGGAELSYKVLPDVSEWTTMRGDPPELFGSEWGVQRQVGDGTSFARLERQNFGTSLNDEQLDLIRDNMAGGIGGVTVRDGRVRTASRTTGADGSRQLYVSYAGSKNTYSFVCTAQPDDSEFWRMCVAADRTLRFGT